MRSTTRISTIVVCGVALFTPTACGQVHPVASPPSPTRSVTSRTTSAPSHSAKPHQTHSASSPGTPAATEFNPPGDIPDNQVFVDFALHGVHIRVPEGWARKTTNGDTGFTDHYNSVALQVGPASHAPTVASARAVEVPQLKSSVTKFQLQRVRPASRAGQQVTEIDYLLDSAQDPVTGKVVRDAAQRFEYFRGGRVAVLTLTGPQNADNVDPWSLVSNSLRWH
jgi:hypothetical protein